MPPIRIEEFDGGPESPYTGTTDIEKNGVLIRINQYLSGQTAENNLVHELFHVILFKEGFNYEAISPHFNEPGNTGLLYVAVAKQIANCYEDVLVDKHMAKDGFEPHLVNGLTAKGLGSINPSDVLNLSQVNHWVDYAAMELYCLSLRPGRFKMEQVEEGYSVNPTIVEKEKNLRTHPSTCNTPSQCFERMKALRDLTGFRDILLKNPSTGKYE